ncbi:MAG: hypothetical protein DMG94_04935 [Acidobacteria bacterium]|nr:MAG: hypothetical protein DMG94_04935 [Acidobacteriota bacterium]
MNLLHICKAFATEDAALDYLIKQRWPDGVRCLACDNAKVYKIATKGKSGKPCRLFECADCGLHFSATTGTLFHDSHLPLQKWFMAMALMGEAKKGISANQVARHIGVQYKTAWYLCHRIRKAMQDMNPTPIGGAGKVVEIDETYLGGRKLRKGVKAHLQTIPNTQAAVIRPILEQKLSPDTKTIITDSHPTYSWLLDSEKHQVTNHKEELRTDGEISTKTIEGAFSLFKRGVIGSYHHLSKDHVDSYLTEFCWRFNRRGMQPVMFGEMLRELVTKKPMTYRHLTREVF